MPKINLKQIVVIFFLFSSVLFAQERVSLVDFLQEIENTHDVRFSYRNSDLESEFVLRPKSTLSLPELISFLRSNTNFSYTILNDKNIAVIARGKTTNNVCGRLVGNMGEPISEAYIIDSKVGNNTISDQDGFFNLTEVGVDAILTIRHLGYEEKLIPASYFNDEKPCKNALLNSKIQLLTEVIVQNVLTSGLNLKSDGSLLIKTKDYGMLPGLIEPDILQIVQKLPGIESINETVSTINIRGGTNDQNLVLWDGIKMYQTGHFFGLISSMNPYVTEEINVYKNGVSAQYGDGVSGMLDFKTSQKLPAKTKGGAGINLINADAYLLAPLSKNIGLQISGRRSINNLFNTPTYDEYFKRAFQDSKALAKDNLNPNDNFSSSESFNFYDLNAKLFLDFNEYIKFRINIFKFDNALSIKESIKIIDTDDEDDDEDESKTSRLEQENIALGLEGLIRMNERWRINLNAYYTNYNLDAVNFNLQSNQSLKQKNELLETSAKANFNYFWNNRINLNFGYQVVETGITNLQEVNNPFFSSSIKNVLTEHAAYSETNYFSNFGFKTTAGVRASYIEDFDEWIFEPRLNMYQKLSPAFSIQLMGELKHQTTTQTIDLQEDFLGVEKRRWTLANGEEFPVVHSRQASFDINYSQKNWIINLTGFLKSVDEITSSNQGFQDQLQFQKLEGKYDIKGVEILIDKKIHDFSVSAAYAYKDNHITFDSLTPSRIPNNQDVKHSLSLITNYKIKNFKFSFGYQWRTGKPFTEPNTDEPISNPGAFQTINFQSPNSSTLPDFSRADFSADYQFFISRFRAVAGLSILNVLDEKNILNSYYTLQTRNNISSIQRIDNHSLGLTPNVSFRLFF